MNSFFTNILSKQRRSTPPAKLEDIHIQTSVMQHSSMPAKEDEQETLNTKVFELRDNRSKTTKEKERESGSRRAKKPWWKSSYSLQGDKGTNDGKTTKEDEEQGSVSSYLSAIFEPSSDLTCLEDLGIFGRVHDKAKLLERVLTENDSDIRNLSIVPVCGSPGIGKTTLIRMVYEDPRVRIYFRLRHWFQGSGSVDFEQLRNKFFGELRSKGRKDMLIVLDDIVEFNIEDLESFAGSGRIVVIISSESFKTSTWNPFEVSRLDDSECWELLMRCAFNEIIDAAMFEDVENKIVTLCDGLPLVVKTIGGVLRHVVEENWCEVYEIFSFQLKCMGDAIMAALMVSYSYLSLDQRSRFLICSTFGKGIAFTRNEVLELWSRAGLVRSSGGTTAAELRNKYFDELQRKAFLEPSYLMNRETHMFVMHSSVYDFCLKIEAEEGQRWHVRAEKSLDVETETGTEEAYQTKIHGKREDGQMEIEEEIQTEIKGDTEAQPVEHDQLSQNSTFEYAPVRRSGIPAQTSSVHSYPFIIGREGDRQKLLKLLQSDGSSQQNVSLVLLMADAGVGKTTLSRLVYNDSIVCETFEI